MKNAIALIKKRLRESLSVFSDGKFKGNLQHALPFWIASLITGVIAVAYTKLFDISERLLHRALAWHDWTIFILAPVSMFIGWYLISRLAPGARGSGIPQVMAAIELPAKRYEKSISKLLSVRIILVKIMSSLFMVLGGGAIGREGPTIQIAGSVFKMMHRWLPDKWPKLAQQNFLVTGAAAGLAAAFNTPLGGIVFAIEELSRIHISYFRTALFTAVIIAGLTAEAILGPYLYLGYPDVKHLGQFIFLGVAAVAILSGLLGSLMSRAILALMRWTNTFNRKQAAIYVLGTGLAVASIAYFLDAAILGSGKKLMTETLYSQNKHVPWYTVLSRITGTVLAFNTGAAGGVFAPALAIGAAIGSWLSGVFGFLGANANLLILGGMVGFLTGVTRTPFTSAILVLEMTDRHSVIFQLMLAAMLANIVALMVDKHSLYERLKQNFLIQAKAETGLERAARLQQIRADKQQQGTQENKEAGPAA